jgi:hypothetical protein
LDKISRGRTMYWKMTLILNDVKASQETRTAYGQNSLSKDGGA